MKNSILKNQQLDIGKIKQNLKTAWLGKDIRYFTEVDSTNTIAKTLAEQGVEEGTVVIAETQTSGRGRLGRRWESPKGGIWLSIILKPELKVKELVKLNLLASVAVAKTIREEFRLNAEVKWPNDVLINWRKVCGILAEAVTKRDRAKHIIVGIGINANFDPTALPENLRTTATSLKEILRREIDREIFICNLLKEFEFYYENFKKGKISLILSEWKKLSCILNRKVQVSCCGEKIEGIAYDIDENGWLIIKLRNGTVKKIFSADVTLRVER